MSYRPLKSCLRSWLVNFQAPFILSQLVLQDMIERGSGSIVNISSGSAVGPGRGPYTIPPANTGGTCYGAEKAALERFTQGLAMEVYEYGVAALHVYQRMLTAKGLELYITATRENIEIRWVRGRHRKQ